MADDRVIIEIELDDSSIKKGFNTVEKEGSSSGKKVGKRLEKGVSKGIEKGGGAGFAILKKGALAAGVALAAVVGAGFAASKFVEAAKIQEDAINDLNSALFATGQFTEEASQDFQNFASSLQQQTKFGDEAILKNAALIQSLGKLSGDGLKGATSAALDLAAALNLDLTTASNLVGRAATGNVALFSRYGVVIKKGATDSETFANALQTLNAQFGGAAARQVQTFSGATTQLGNTFGDLFEEIGFLITKSPEVITFVKILEQSFTAAIGIVQRNAEGIRQFIGSFVRGFLTAGQIIVGTVAIIRNAFANSEGVGLLGVILERTSQIIVENFVPALGFLVNAGTLVIDSLKSGFQSLLVGVLSTVQGVNNALSFLGVDTGFSEQIDNLVEGANTTLDGFNTKTNETFDNLLSPAKFEEQGAEFIEGFANFIDQAKNVAVSEETGDSVFSDLLKPFSKENVELVLGNVKTLQTGLGKNLKTINKNISNTAKQATFDLKNRLGGAIAGGVENITQSLLKGENVFGNFAKAALSTIGGLAVQLGKFFIIQGIAVEALKSISGAAAIAAGAGLVALGTILKSLGGGSGGFGGAAGGAGSSIGAPQDTPASDTEISANQPLAEEERNSPAVVFQTTVQGDVFDSTDTRSRLFNIFQEGAEEEGIELDQGVFA